MIIKRLAEWQLTDTKSCILILKLDMTEELMNIPILLL